MEPVGKTPCAGQRHRFGRPAAKHLRADAVVDRLEHGALGTAGAAGALDRVAQRGLPEAPAIARTEEVELTTAQPQPRPQPLGRDG